MSANLDKSLDDIVVGRRQDARRRGSRRNKASTATGGVKKNKATKASTGKGAKSAPAPAPKDSKIMVSGMVSLILFSLLRNVRFPYGQPLTCVACRCE